MSDTPDFLAERLRHEGEKTTAFFLGLSPDVWEQVVYAEGRPWTVRQVLAHFVSVEGELFRLVENIAGNGSGAPENFNIDAFNQREVAALEAVPPPSLIERFQAYRQRTADWTARLSPADLEKQGRHPFVGLAPLAEIIRLIYRHNQIHQRDIRKLLA